MRVISQQSLQWRRDKVRELTIRGYTQGDIAAELKISATIINRDLKQMRQDAKQNIKHYIDEYLPAEYLHCLDGLNKIMKEAWQMSLDGDKRERMQALSLAKDCYAMKLDLLSNASVVDRAITFVENHTNKNLGRGLTDQNSEVLIDDTAEPIENTG